MTFPWDHQLRGLLKLANKFGEHVSPLASVLSPKNRKRTSNKKSLTRKIQNSPPKNVCPQIGNIALRWQIAALVERLQ
jgi:hypothetical protein